MANFEGMEVKYTVIGTVTLENKEYKVIHIVSFENGNQDIELLDVETGEKSKMLFRK